MKKVLMFAIAAALLLAFTVPGHSWTGRMAGMGNPYGLVEDESDFLTHPTAITQGKGWQFYGDLGVNYKDVKKWDVSGYFGGTLANIRSADGSEWNTDASFGFTFPVNTGRMGFFFGYSGNFLSRGKYDGNGAYTGLIGSYGTFDVRNDIDTYFGRVLYAQPFTDKVKFGGEFSIGYIREKSTDSYAVGTAVGENYFPDVMFINNFQYALPYDSKYWEAKMKASVEGMIGSSKLNFTAFGGFILGGDSDLSWSFGYPYPVAWGSNSGSTSGYHIGAEVWWRFSVNKTIAIPILAKAVYSEKKRDGTGFTDMYTITDYNSREKTFNVEVGGGIDAQFAKSSRFAAGLYYNFINNKNDFFLSSYPTGFYTSDYISQPKWREHRVALKLAGEVGISPTIALNGGLNFFYGWVKQDLELDSLIFPYNLGFDGHTWGLGLSAGAAFKFNGFVLEPYLKGSYQSLSTSGTGTAFNSTYASGDYKKNQWNVGGGFAIKFN